MQRTYKFMSGRTFQIGESLIGRNEPCFIIAEVAQAHDGSLGFAHSYIDAAAEAGANAIKFQTHIAGEESTRDEQWRVKFSYEDVSRYDYWQRMEFLPEHWAGLAEHARKRGLVFLSSAFSHSAVELLERLGMPAYKVASGETGSTALLDSMIRTGKPILISTGMSPWSEIDACVERVRAAGNEAAVFQCTSKYPTPLDQVGLNVLEEIANRYDLPAGLSDHSGSVHPALAAISSGTAHLLEVHATFHKGMFGPDVPASLTFEELKFVCEHRDAVERMRRNPVEKNELAAELATMRALFNKSVALKADQPAGTVLTEDMLTIKKPGSGIPGGRLQEVIGRKLRVSTSANVLLDPAQLDPEFIL